MESHKKLTIVKFLLVPILVGVGACATISIIYVTKEHNQTRTNEQTHPSDGRRAITKPPEIAYVPGLPQRIIIPKINTSAAIDSMGLTPSGDLDAPENIANAGWYNAGPRAGSKGSAVIDGHFGGTKDNPAVFDNLHTLVAGDKVLVEDSDKRKHTFIVKSTRLFQPDEDASEVYRSEDNAAHLNLITCQGQWINREETYTSRLVVFTDLLTNVSESN